MFFIISTSSRLTGYFLSPASLSSCVPTVLIIHSTGISTCCPSTTTLVLALGPDLPRADQLHPGILRLSTYMILTYISLLIPAFSLLFCPRSLSLSLLPYRMLLYQCRFFLHSVASVVCFSPGHFRRKTSRLVSCYALFECMAASEPTS